MLWGLVMRILSKREKRVVLVGSAGVGKSCFVMLVSLYVALVEKKKFWWYDVCGDFQKRVQWSTLMVRRARAFEWRI